ncbi:ATP-binding cassette domain-containing protein [Parasphingopyxis lamellibrachiae]|uniref:Osmoprotectant transport system ATP-binding protein n=1 Tax=Parasphingopyxis lamellibrachiae TaxID=680125 RepID=A0A3D9FI61_9SPHN|nr:ATP-binding cassette domain-containing protein [Parasphingopyxis lamellibrachiae]RED17484.1 osmoprotectant transport system ATP-binding protein [Parasphingopyxis lamellibrachiae]
MDRKNGPAVSFDGIAKSFDGGATFAVKPLSLEIAGGSFVALVGESGSGKSTLLKMINRLVDPSTGTVAIAATPVDDQTSSDLRRHIGYVFQNIGLFPHMSVAENIMIIPRLGDGRIVNAVPDLLELVGLPGDVADRLPSELSGGQQQRVGVARALAGEPGLMLMDEPFGALDPVTRDQLGETYRALHDRLGLTTIMVTHDMAEALLIADRILVMSEGRVAADGTPEALLAGEGGAEANALIAVPKGQMAKLRQLEARS